MKKKMIAIFAGCMIAGLLCACGTSETSAQSKSSADSTSQEKEENRKPLTNRFFAEIVAEQEAGIAGTEEEAPEEEVSAEEDLQENWPDSYKYLLNMNMSKR